MGKTYITVKEAACLLCVTERTIQLCINDGKYSTKLIPGKGRGGIQYLIALDSLPEEAQECYKAQNSTPAPLNIFSQEIMEKYSIDKREKAIERFNIIVEFERSVLSGRAFVRKYNEEHSTKLTYRKLEYDLLNKKVIAKYAPNDLGKVYIYNKEGKFVCQAIVKLKSPFRSATEEDFKEAAKHRKRVDKLLKEYAPNRRKDEADILFSNIAEEHHYKIEQEEEFEKNFTNEAKKAINECGLSTALISQFISNTYTGDSQKVSDTLKLQSFSRRL